MSNKWNKFVIRQVLHIEIGNINKMLNELLKI